MYFEREENKPDKNMILAIRFLDGQFAKVLDKGLHKSEALGWTGTFMKQGIALFLIYLHEGRWNGKGIVSMAEMAKNAMRFSAMEYRKGACVPAEVDEDDLFSRLFFQWKIMMPMAYAIGIIIFHWKNSLLNKSSSSTSAGTHAPFLYSIAENLIAFFAISAIETIPLPFHLPSCRYIRNNAIPCFMKVPVQPSASDLCNPLSNTFANCPSKNLIAKIIFLSGLFSSLSKYTLPPYPRKLPSSGR